MQDYQINPSRELNIGTIWRCLQSSSTVGMKAGAPALNDPIQAGSTDPNWETPFPTPQKIHGLITIACSDDFICQTQLSQIKTFFGSAISEVTTVSGKVRPGAMKGHEQ